MPKKGQTVAKPETLLRRLASTAKSDAVRLRAIELILFLQGRLNLAQASSARKNIKADELNDLVVSQATHSQDVERLNEFGRQHEAELLMLAER